MHASTRTRVTSRIFGILVLHKMEPTGFVLKAETGVGRRVCRVRYKLFYHFKLTPTLSQ